MRRAAPEPNKRALYVGGLDQRVTEDILRQIFETAGHVVSVKIIPDKIVGDLQVPSVGTVSFFSPVCNVHSDGGQAWVSEIAAAHRLANSINLQKHLP